MIRTFLGWFGIGIRYEDARGLFDYRYDALDFQMSRPIHDTMSVAMPTAKLRFYRL